MHVAWFARRAAFSLMYVLVMFMLHARAVRFVHAFCSDVVVLVSALLIFVLFFGSFLALFPVPFSGLLTVFCLLCCRLFVRCICSLLLWPFGGSDCWRSFVRYCFTF